MTHKSNQLVFFGTEDFSAEVLARLIEAGFDFEAIITKPDAKKGRGQKLQAPTVKIIAENYNIPVFQPQNLTEMRACIAQTSRTVGLLVSFGKIIPQDIIDGFQFGIINLHPSLLPKYRGPSPIETAILNGDDITGVTVMSLDAKMDAGPIYAQTVIQLTPQTTANDLYRLSSQIGSKLLVQTIPKIMTGTLKPEAQIESQASYCKLLIKSQNYLDPESASAQQLANQIRAFERFPRSRMVIFEQPCIITKAIASPEITSPINFECKDGNFLNINQLIAPSGKTMSAEGFINGYKN